MKLTVSLAIVVLTIVGITATQLPDIQRYLKIRSM